ncbi:MAG: DUF4178 domain-containing protein [Tibeticola sp.]
MAERIYRAPCPGCGAPVAFQSAQSTHAVCGYCQSIVVREGEVLKRIGKMAELFDDHSPLQLGASGRIDGQPFTLVGRLQVQYGEGVWTEWVALFDDGTRAWLSEDNGAYVFSRPVAATGALPAAADFIVGQMSRVGGETYTVASNQTVSLRSAQGELPKLPPLGVPFSVVELRGIDRAQVLSIDYSPQLGDPKAAPELSSGQPVALEALGLSGLRDESAKDEQGRQFACPNCGAPVVVQLEQSKSVTCPNCKSLIDLSQGIGGELRHAVQDEPVRPLIALGKVGVLDGVHWQVVGFQHRMGQEAGDDESFGWEEYLLYNRKKGFGFLVDATDGWSLVAPLTGSPSVSSDKRRATWQGTAYTLTSAYRATTTYVLGEFYWQVQRGQQTDNRDYAAGDKLLSSEQSATELTWSGGKRMAADTVARAFGLEDKKALLARSDAAPFSSAPGMSLRTVIIIFLVLIVLSMIMSRCSDCDPNTQNCATSSTSTRSSGGSFGGYSSGGGHK